MTAKEYLRKAYRLEEYIWALIEQREKLKDQQAKVTSIISGMPLSSGIGDRVGRSSVAITDLENRIDQIIQEQRELKAEVLTRINGLDLEEHRTILVHRHMNFKSWFEIARNMYCGKRTAQRKHTEALIAFEEKYPEI